MKVEYSLHRLELDAVHEVVYHPLHNERSVYVRCPTATQHDNAFMGSIRRSCAVDGGEVNGPSFLLEECLGGAGSELYGLSS